jgi:uncharacterized protein (TIGR02300 family)
LLLTGQTERIKGSPLQNRTKGTTHVAKADLGTKRICPNCGAKYYDLNRDPIICPRCGTQFEASSRTRAAVSQVDDDEVEETETEGAEFISLEEADAEVSGGEDEDEDIDTADDAEDAFLEPEEEEEGDDVADIVGDVDDEET